MANNNGLNVLDAITAAKLAKGGGTGEVTKKYVDDGLALKQDKTMSASVTIGAETETTVEGAIGELADLVPSTAAPATNKLATTGDVNGEEIAVTASTSPVSTASGSLRKIVIFGKSEVVDGDIHSAGEGWATVDLGTLTWILDSTYNVFIANVEAGTGEILNAVCSAYRNVNVGFQSLKNGEYNYGQQILTSGIRAVAVKDTAYSDPGIFKTAMNGVMLTYQLTDPTQGNCIAVKTDDGTGIDGTMATFTTGTPLRGITGGAQDVAVWDGSSGEVTKNCAEVRLADLNWTMMIAAHNRFISNAPGGKGESDNSKIAKGLCTKYKMISVNSGYLGEELKGLSIGATGDIWLWDNDYTSLSDFVASLGDAKLVYELATPTTEQFTASENTSFAALQTYSPQTAISINDSPDFSVEAYAGTANGKAVAELDKTLNGKIDSKITVSSTLTLAANAWSNNTQTVTFAHDTTKRNVIDITPSEVAAWAAAGVYASAETSTGITFTCATVPETALTFKVTSMEVS